MDRILNLWDVRLLKEIFITAINQIMRDQEKFHGKLNYVHKFKQVKPLSLIFITFLPLFLVSIPDEFDKKRILILIWVNLSGRITNLQRSKNV